MADKSKGAAKEPEVVTDEVSESAELAITPSGATGDLGMFETDPNAELLGVWFRDVASGTRLKIAHEDNANFSDYLNMIMRPYLSLIQSNTREGYALFRKLRAKAAARFILVDWEGVKLDGKDVPYSEERAKELLTAG
jgi:hypothetical protein